MNLESIVLRVCLGLSALAVYWPHAARSQPPASPGNGRSEVFSTPFEPSLEHALGSFRNEHFESYGSSHIEQIEWRESSNEALENQLLSLDLFRSLAAYDRGLSDRAQSIDDGILSNASPASRTSANGALLAALEFFAHSPLRRVDVEAGLRRLQAITEVGAASAAVQPEIYFWRAEALRALGEFSPAAEAYKQSLAKSSDPRLRALVAFRFAELEEREQHFASADSLFEAATRSPESPLRLYAMLRRAAVQRSERKYRELLATVDTAEALYGTSEHIVRTSARSIGYVSPLLEELMLRSTEHDRIIGSSSEPPLARTAVQPPQIVSAFYPSELALLRGSALSELGEYERATEILTAGDRLINGFSDSLRFSPNISEEARFVSDALRFERAWSLFQRAKYKDAAAAFLELSVTDSIRRQRLLRESPAILREQGRYFDPFLNDSTALYSTSNIDRAVLAKSSIDTTFFLYNDFPERARFYAGIALARAGMLGEASDVLLKPTLDKSMLYSDRAQYQLALIRFAQHSYEAQKLLEPIAYEQSTRGAYASFLLGELAYRRNFYERAEAFLLNSFANLPQEDTASRSTAHLERGLSLIPLGNWPEAADELHTYLALARTSEPGKTDEALYWLGKSYFRNAQYDSARTVLERLLHDFPASSRIVDAQYAYAWSLFGSDDFSRAEPAFEKVIAMDSITRYSYDALARAGDSYYASGDYYRASKLYNQAVDRPAFNDFRTTRAILMLGVSRMKLDSSRSAMLGFAYLTTKYPRSDIVDEAYFNEALAAYAINQYGTAEQAIEKLVSLYHASPLAARGLYVAGEERSRRDDLKGAASYYARVVRDYPNARETGTSLFALQDALVQLKRIPEALAVGDTFVTRNPNNGLIPEILLKAGELKLQLGEAASALTNFQRFVEVYPAHVERPRAELNVARAELAAKDTTAALNQLQRVITTYDTVDIASEALLTRARIARAKKLTDSAARDFLAAADIRYYSSDAAPQALFEYGQMLADLKKVDSAIAIFSQVYVRYPIESFIGARAAIRVAELEASREHHEPARELLLRVASSHHNDLYGGAAFVRIGESYLVTNDAKLASETFSTARKEYSLSADANIRALYGLARANARLGRKAEAVRDLKILLELRGITQETRTEADSLLQQLQPPPKKKQRGH